MKIIQSNKKTRFIYGTLLNDIDVDWTLDISTLSQYLQILLDIPAKFSPPPGCRYMVVSNQHHLNVLLRSVGDGSLQESKLLTIIDFYSIDYVHEETEFETIMPDNFPLEYAVSIMLPKDEELKNRPFAAARLLQAITAKEMNKQTRSSMEDFPWKSLYSGFPICYEGKYIIAHKKRKTG